MTKPSRRGRSGRRPPGPVRKAKTDLSRVETSATDDEPEEPAVEDHATASQRFQRDTGYTEYTVPPAAHPDDTPVTLNMLKNVVFRWQTISAILVLITLVGAAGRWIGSVESDLNSLARSVEGIQDRADSLARAEAENRTRVSAMERLLDSLHRQVLRLSEYLVGPTSTETPSRNESRESQQTSEKPPALPP